MRNHPTSLISPSFQVKSDAAIINGFNSSSNVRSIRANVFEMRLRSSAPDDTLFNLSVAIEKYSG